MRNQTGTCDLSVNGDSQGLDCDIPVVPNSPLPQAKPQSREVRRDEHRHCLVRNGWKDLEKMGKGTLFKSCSGPSVAESSQP